MRYNFAIERHEPCPPAIAKQIRGPQRTCNLTNMPWRWKVVAFSDKKEDLQGYVDATHRVIDWNTLEVVIENK